MLKAVDIETLIPKDGSLILMMTRTKDGQLSVVVDQKYPKSPASDVLKEALSPKLVVGTPAELDAGFMEFLKTKMTAANSLNEATSKIEQETKEALDKIKAESMKKVTEASKTKGKTSTSSTSKTASKSSATASPTKALLGDLNEEDDGEETETKLPAATEVKPEEKAEEKKSEPSPAPKAALELF